MKVNNSTFDRVQPSIDISRSTWKMPFNHKTTFNEGELVPIFINEVLPGDTFKMKTNSLVRLSTLLTPIMDDLYLDLYYFFVPNRLVWEHWINLMGENTQTAAIPITTYSVPQITTTSGNTFVAHSVADHFGLPTNITNLSVSALPFRAYCKVYLDWFRDENLQSPTDSRYVLYNDDTNRVVNSTDANVGGALLKVNKLHDYFTSALPYPQKAADVLVPGISNGNVVVDSKALNKDVYSNTNKLSLTPNSSTTGGEIYNNPVVAYKTTGSTVLGSTSFRDSFPNQYNVADFGTNYTYGALVVQGAANLSINQLRLAFQMQKLYEKDARGGTRYIEMIKTHFNTTCPDYRLQRSEYLGGNRTLINIQSIYQTSATQSGSTPQGNVAAYSLTFNSDNSFVKSFTEHGFIIGVCCVRHKHTYQQGIEKFWARKDRLDYYFPVLANIGEQPIYNKEIYAIGTQSDNEVFGYQEAFADYRYKPSSLSGEFRSNFGQSLDMWHLADKYNQLPVLNNSWICEDKNSLDRCLAVNTHAQFLGDFNFDMQVSRAMPLYSVPGLIDHH